MIELSRETLRIFALVGVSALTLGLAGCEPADDGAADPGACDPATPPTWYADGDGDGQGDVNDSVADCEQPAGYVANSDDPDPSCADGRTDECGVCGGSGAPAWFADTDRDGLGDPYDGTVGCEQPDGYVANADDLDPRCATNDTDVCGVCGGPGGEMWYADQDEDGFGDPEIGMEVCEPVPGFVDNSLDLEPNCATNDTDDCGECGGPGVARYFADQDGDGNGDPEVFVDACVQPDNFVENAIDPEPRCATDDTDDCGVCAGAGRDKDCVGVCFGEAFNDGCGRCVGGTTGRVAFVEDADENGIPDTCDQCAAEPTARAVIQWTDVPAFGAEGVTGPYTFQVVLYENGDFAFHYADIEPFGASVTVGHQGMAGRNSASLGVDSDYPREEPITYFRARDDGRVELDYTARSDWLDVAATGESLEFIDDDGFVEVPLDFEFPYDGARYDVIRVGANGIIALGGPAPGAENGPMGDPELGAFLAPFWDNLDPATGGQVHLFGQAAECERDCAGMFGGVALQDDCGVCIGGTSANDPRAHIDCSGACFGEAAIDGCGQCAGGETGVAPAPPGACMEAPDLLVDEDYLRSTITLDYINADDPCLINERCVQGEGRRKIIRFGTRIANVGNADLQLGRPSDDNEQWVWDQCHGHFHFNAYAAYELYDPVTERTLPVGAKSGFAVIDIGVYDPDIAVDGCRGYNGSNQGITAGCQDTYSRNLQCQWIDITGLPNGVYDVVVTTNPEGQIVELDTDNNSARVRVEVEGDRLQIVDVEPAP